MESKKETIASILIVVVTILIISWGLYEASTNDEEGYDLSLYAKTGDLESLNVRIQGTEDGISKVQTQLTQDKDKTTSIGQSYEPSADCIAVDSQQGDGKKIWMCTDYSGG